MPSNSGEVTKQLERALESVVRSLEAVKQNFSLSDQHLASDLVDDLIEQTKDKAKAMKDGVQEATPGLPSPSNDVDSDNRTENRANQDTPRSAL